MEQPSMSQQPWPSELNAARQGHGLEIKDKYTVRYAVDARHIGDTVGSIQANHPVPTNCTVYYYELTVFDAGVYGKIAIGFADKSFKLTRQPGWEIGSYGYHGDDGKKFIGSGHGEDYGPTFSTGDTVGAGIHMGRQELFFTKNGTKLKMAHRPVRSGLYPTIGLHSKGEMVQVNFGQKPFVFDLEGMLAEEKAAQRAAVDRLPVAPGITHMLVRQYLLHYGYEETLRAFDEAAGLGGLEPLQPPPPQQQQGPAEADRAASAASTSSSCRPHAESDAASALPLRARLRSCVMSGDVDGALALLAAQCPAVLADSGRFGQVHFQLACQKYIELVRAGRVQEAVLFAQRTLSQLRGPSAASLEPSLRDVVALVAYQDPQASPLAHLMGRGQRDAVADAVNAAILAVVSEPSGGGAAADAAAGGGAAAAAEPLPPPQLQLRPALAAGASELAAAAVAAAASRPVSAVEALLQQLVAVQGSLHEANGGQGSAFNLQEYMPGPAT
ncbi:hypothetical protein PLESTB_001044600 [Pleodorina starrii]|uniref:Uncharacterized protein n=1 Tax=Pleodorina starrii TaxID=330485 RepID=A0A9W6F513_9CHLO|nr:hypothetical protein PLESTB_001044600 [Pleodorina starrii]